MKISTKKINTKTKFTIKREKLIFLNTVLSSRDNKRNFYLTLDKAKFLNLIKGSSLTLSTKASKLLNFNDFLLK